MDVTCFLPLRALARLANKQYGLVVSHVPDGQIQRKPIDH
jgi:hypothetical protein